MSHFTQLEDWDVSVRSVPAGGLEGRIKATADQRTALAAAADILGIDKLKATYRLRQAGRSAFRLTGRIKAEVRQSCVVTLDPVAACLEEDIDCIFGVGPPPQPEDGEDLPILSGSDWEEIEDDRLAIGRVVAETIVGALDPFPRARDAAFEAMDSIDAHADRENHPFAALKALKLPGKQD